MGHEEWPRGRVGSAASLRRTLAAAWEYPGGEAGVASCRPWTQPRVGASTEALGGDSSGGGSAELKLGHTGEV